MDSGRHRKHNKESEAKDTETRSVRSPTKSPPSSADDTPNLVRSDQSDTTTEDRALPSDSVTQQGLQSDNLNLTDNQRDRSNSSSNVSPLSGWDIADHEDNSSTQRPDRVVQLIHNTNHDDRINNWVINDAFYNEDIIGIHSVVGQSNAPVVIDEFRESDTQPSHPDGSADNNSSDDEFFEETTNKAPKAKVDKIEETFRCDEANAIRSNDDSNEVPLHFVDVINLQSTDSEDNIVRSKHSIPTNRDRSPTSNTDRSHSRRIRIPSSSSTNNNNNINNNNNNNDDDNNQENDNRYAGQIERGSHWRVLQRVADLDESNFGDDDQGQDEDGDDEEDGYMIGDHDDDRGSWHGEGRYDDEDEDEDEDEDDDEDEEIDGDDIMDHEFVVAGDEFVDIHDSDDEDEYDYFDDQHMDDINYDRTLPDNHAYLGDNLEESRGREVLVENSSTTLSLINLEHIVLLPGQTLPLSITDQNDTIHFRIRHALIQCIHGKSKTIGIMCDPRTNDIGTTAELRNYSIELEEIKLIFEGRQRFKLLSPPFETALQSGLVKILPEITLGSPFPQIRASLHGFQPQKPMLIFNRVSKFPNWVYSSCDAKTIIPKIIDHIRDWSKFVDIKTDPKDFSYWMSANLPISNETRMKALRFGCTEARLLWLLDLLNNSNFFGCANCQNHICRTNDVFPMSRAGPQNSFVNAGGYIHDTITVRRADGIAQAYAWTNDHTWFPGYAWSYAYCNYCNQHLGWCYKSNDPHTKPERFVGFTRSNIRLIYKNLE